MQQKINDDGPFAPSTDRNVFHSTLARSFLLHWLIGNEEAHSAEKKLLWVVSYKWGIWVPLLPGEDSGNIYYKRRLGECKSQSMERSAVMLASGHGVAIAHMNTNKFFCLHRFTSWNLREEEQPSLRSYPRPENMSNIISH